MKKEGLNNIYISKNFVKDLISLTSGEIENIMKKYGIKKWL